MVAGSTVIISKGRPPTRTAGWHIGALVAQLGLTVGAEPEAAEYGRQEEAAPRSSRELRGAAWKATRDASLAVGAEPHGEPASTSGHKHTRMLRLAVGATVSMGEPDEAKDGGRVHGFHRQRLGGCGIGSGGSGVFDSPGDRAWLDWRFMMLRVWVGAVPWVVPETWCVL